MYSRAMLRLCAKTLFLDTGDGSGGGGLTEMKGGLVGVRVGVGVGVRVGVRVGKVGGGEKVVGEGWGECVRCG